MYSDFKENVQFRTSETKKISKPRQRALSDIDINSINKERRLALKSNSKVEKCVDYFENLGEGQRRKSANNYLHIDTLKITTQRKYTPDSVFSDEVFIDAKEHINFQDVKQNTNSKQTLALVTTDSENKNKQRKPLRKNSTIVKYKNVLGENTSSAGSNCSLLGTEHLQDIIYEAVGTEYNFILRRNYRNKQNSSLVLRNNTLNWLLNILDYIGVEVAQIFITVQLFDYVLVSVKISERMYFLIAIVTFWIVHKYFDCVKPFMASSIVALSEGLYTTQEVLKMERKLLVLFKFSINRPEPSLFVAHYELTSKFERPELLRAAALYILESFIFQDDFSTVVPSHLAANAWKVSMTLLIPGCKFLPDDPYNKKVKTSMIEQVKKMQDPKYGFKLPYTKYSREENHKISIIVEKNINLCLG